MSNKSQSKTIALNRRARFDYHIEETLEAGIVLKGSEVKSLRLGKCSLQDAYADYANDNLVLINCYIAGYDAATYLDHEERRPRKLLLHQRQIKKWGGAAKRDGMTIVPLAIYFNSRGIVKVELGLAKGKKLYDKRETIKEREWKREQGRQIRIRG